MRMITSSLNSKSVNWKSEDITRAAVSVSLGKLFQFSNVNNHHNKEKGSAVLKIYFGSI